MYSMVDSLIMGYAALRALLRFLIVGRKPQKTGDANKYSTLNSRIPIIGNSQMDLIIRGGGLFPS